MSDTTTHFEPFFDAMPLMGDAAGLRAKMAEDGYLFLPGLLPRQSVEPLYQEILALCREAGWVTAEGTAAGAPRLEGSDEWWEVYDALQKRQSFHALAHDPALIATIEALTGEPVLVHPRNIARITFPDAAFFTTPAHQDYPLIQGTPDFYTAWTPLCACPEERGGLAILDKSHRSGVLPVEAATGPGGLTVRAEGLPDCTWRGQSMGAGDVLIFHSHTVHAGRPNRSARDLRMSADYRYQGVSQPVVADSLEPHYGRLTWEEITADWSDRDLAYYWTRLPLNIVERDVALQTPGAKRR